MNNLNDVTKAGDILHALDKAAEALIRCTTDDRYGVAWLLPAKHPAHEKLRAAAGQIVSEALREDIQKHIAELAALGIVVSDQEITARAEKAEADRQERQAKYEAKQKADEANAKEAVKP